MISKIDFAYPEDVLIRVVHRAKETNGWMVTHTKVVSNGAFIGAGAYEQLFSGFLQYVMKDILEKPEEGYHRVVGISAVFGQWINDGNIQYCHLAVEPITEEEFNDGR